ncbi:MAG TPA: AfsR/SARP family transcriptional regulator [Actinophytocola sp.]|jgi:DNA-binding SARP family transcriptional activator|uniref:AfsR/SARP family transcriptional regulator n=1 Tax=Actinophytocola sp. TaxID=1872138 RepID=UPI002E092BED|nr:AfsR/SARP family transcriptional regulator [Actinophytocola sp.]
MRYEVLGPLCIVDDHGTSAFISARKMEILLAALLIRNGQVLTAPQIITEIWGENNPRRANAALYVYISQLRKFLHRPDHQSPIVTRPLGYLLRTGDDVLDLHEFQALVVKGRDHTKARRHAAAADAFGAALELWRGPALGDLRGDGPIINGFTTWIGEARLECVEMHIDARLALGQHRELVSRLYGLVTDHPLRESFYRQLMLALYRSERQADALSVYQSARRILNEELGLEPCRSLRDLHQAILLGDETLDVPLGPFSAVS